MKERWEELQYRYRRDVVWSDLLSFFVLLLGGLCLGLIGDLLVSFNSPLILLRIFLIFGVLSIAVFEAYVIYKIRTAWRW
ncbi:MAG: hypothetical protein IKZ87_03705, partial [Actinomycetaceae bacterium]|nr:hypothetical protein [Actinomycetaceae bacterium]